MGHPEFWQLPKFGIFFLASIIPADRNSIFKITSLSEHSGICEFHNLFTELCNAYKKKSLAGQTCVNYVILFAGDVNYIFLENLKLRKISSIQIQ